VEYSGDASGFWPSLPDAAAEPGLDELVRALTEQIRLQRERRERSGEPAWSE
jgi:hypothetical protein